jgi:hypothetical protein
MSDTRETTNVQQIDVDLADIFGLDAGSVMTPADGSSKKQGILSPMTVDTSFLDKPFEANDNEPPANPPAGPPADPGTPPVNLNPGTPPAGDDDDDPLGMPGNPPAGDPDADKNKGGRPTVAVGALKSLIEKKVVLPFDDGKKLEEYTQEDIEELIEANIQQVRESVQNDVPQQFFQSLPAELQQAYQYVANGGQDLKGLFQSLAASQEIQSLDPSNEQGQLAIIRSYLQATNYGTPEEIEDEIYSLQDRGELEKKANQFKPKLDSMQQQMVNQRIAAQEQANRQRMQQAQMYQENVYRVLEKAEINGVKLDNRVQNMLYAGLVQPNYPSVSGKQTNLLGHLLEKYQFVEPRHDLIAEALWLLADPDGYRQELRGQGQSAAAIETARRLKTEQQAARSGSHVDDEPDNNSHQPQNRPAIQRPKRNFFGR